MPIDVPAYVQVLPYVQSHVLVQGGTNWDLSRSARVTPIVVLVDPEPILAPPVPAEVRAPKLSHEDAVPSTPPVCVVRFPQRDVTISQADQAALTKIPKRSALTVVAHVDVHESDADRLARARADTVARWLRGKGYTVQSVKVLGGMQPTLDSDTLQNAIRSIEVFAATASP